MTSFVENIANVLANQSPSIRSSANLSLHHPVSRMQPGEVGQLRRVYQADDKRSPFLPYLVVCRTEGGEEIIAAFMDKDSARRYAGRNPNWQVRSLSEE